MNHIKNIIVILLCLVGLSNAQGNIRRGITLGVSGDLLEDVNITDAKVALELWIKQAASNYQNIDYVNVKIFSDSSELVELALGNKLDLLYISPLLYTMLKNNISLVPILKAKVNNTEFYSSILFSNKEMTSKKFFELRGKKIIVQGGKYKIVNEMWLDLLCLENGISDKNSFFSKVEFVDKPMQAVLAVFFNNAEYCIVSNASFDIIKEMNPQVSKSLKKVISRENLVNEIICINTSLNDAEKKMILTVSSNYQGVPKNAQINKIFKSTGATQIKESDLDGIINLWNDYKNHNTKNTN
jgi:ABC-type phosphate/phosphonate transport system substrate-binding protein